MMAKGIAKRPERFDWRKDLLLPVSVNVITAILLVLGALALKEPLLDFFNVSEPEYPILCVPEPVAGAQDPNLMDVELFIINQGPELLQNEDLTRLLNAKASREGLIPKSPDIALRATRSVQIADVRADEDFNRSKGTIEIIRPRDEGGEWRIRIVQIRPYAIFRVRVSTGRKLLGATRGEMTRVPIEIDYAGRNPL